MSEKNLQVFIDGVVRYFDLTTDNDLKVGTPYLAPNHQATALDYTGIINITGNTEGCVYFTAPRIMLKHLIMSLGESDTCEANLIDLVGEVANTISGNARRELGKSFVISVPTVVPGAPSCSQLYLNGSDNQTPSNQSINNQPNNNQRAYVIPVSWRSYSAAVVICLQNEVSYSQAIH